MTIELHYTVNRSERISKYQDTDNNYIPQKDDIIELPKYGKSFRVKERKTLMESYINSSYCTVRKVTVYLEPIENDKQTEILK